MFLNDFEQEIILCSKGWYDQYFPTGTPRGDMVKALISIRAGVDFEYIGDSDILAFIYDILDKIDITPSDMVRRMIETKNKFGGSVISNLISYIGVFETKKYKLQDNKFNMKLVEEFNKKGG